MSETIKAKAKKAKANPFSGKLVPILTVALVVSAFLVGSLYTKVQMLEKGGVATQGSINNQPLAAVAQPQAPQQPTKGVASIDDDPVLGDKNASVTIIEFSDYECPFCKKFHTETRDQIISEYVDTEKAIVVWKDLPLPFHDPLATKQAVAAQCVNKLVGKEKYFEYGNLIFENTTSNIGMEESKLAELAQQIDMEFKSLAIGLNLYSVLCIGGTSMYSQKRDLQKYHSFLICTPGRIKDLAERRWVNLSTYNNIIMDEVDRMFDMGFGKDVAFLVDKVPTPRQNFFFSATLSSNIEQLFAKYLVNPIKIDIKTTDGINTIEQDIVRIPKAVKKIDILHDLLIKEGFNKVLVFGRTKHGVKDTHQELVNRGFKADSIHGNKTQAQRQKSLNAFKENKVNILVATDVAARGIDVMDITHVINFDIPATKEDYTHRIGRTGRANKKGTALTFVE